jgi:hypothetical protein
MKEDVRRKGNLRDGGKRSIRIMEEGVRTGDSEGKH